MHIDARNLENGSLLEADICIVGAGAAGISMAMAKQGSLGFKHLKVAIGGLFLFGGNLPVEF